MFWEIGEGKEKVLLAEPPTVAQIHSLPSDKLVGSTATKEIIFTIGWKFSKTFIAACGLRQRCDWEHNPNH